MIERPNRDRPANNPGGMQCERCDEIFIGEEWHSCCAVCLAKLQLRHPPAFASAMRKEEP